MADLTSEKLIKQGEGFKEGTYKDTAGKDTIGYGFNMTEPFIKNIVGNKAKISKEEAGTAFNKIHAQAKQDATQFVGKKVFDGLDEDRKSVLVDMAYNLGLPRLLKFKKLRDAVVDGDFKEAGAQILDSDYAKQVKGRATRNADIMAGQTPAQRISKQIIEGLKTNAV